MSASDHIYGSPEAEPIMSYESRKTPSREEISLESLDDSSSPTSAREMARRRRKPKEESLLGMLRVWIIDHQIGVYLESFLNIYRLTSNQVYR